MADKLLGNQSDVLPEASHGITPGGVQKQIKVDGDGHIQQGRATAVVSNRKTISSPGTAETLVAASTPCLWVDVSADTLNGAEILVGASDVKATPGSQKGIVLFAGNPATRIFIDDVVKLFVDTQNANDAVVFNYYT